VNTFVHGTGIRLVGLTVLMSLLPMSAPAEDVWSSGLSLEPWERIESLQKYPLLASEPTPDWEGLCNDRDPWVRTAAALAIGRTGDPELISPLVPLLEDKWPVTRRCALQALLQMDSPLVKEPLLEVIGSWEDLDTNLPGLHNLELLQRIGLPSELRAMELSERRAWLEKFEAAEWKPGFSDSLGPVRNVAALTRVIFCPEKSQWDAGEAVLMRVQVSRLGGRETLKVRITEGPGSWHAINRNGEIFDNYGYSASLYFPRDLEGADPDVRLVVGPGRSAVADLRLSSKRKPQLPGIYLFHAFDAPVPVIVRVRRNAQFEKRIPELMSGPTPSLKVLAEQRVQEAAPPFIELYRKFALRDNSFGSRPLAEALGRLGDRAAIPVLLDFPRTRSVSDIDVHHGDTSKALREFGELAHPYYGERIVSWKDELDKGNGYALAMCLKLLGPRGSEQVDRKRLEILDELSRKETDYQRGDDELGVLRACVLVVAEKHPQKAIEAIWATKRRPNTCGALLNAVAGLDSAIRDPIVEALWQRFKEAPHIERRLGEQIVGAASYRMGEILLRDESPIAFESEALETLRGAFRKRDLQARTAGRIESFLRGNPSPSVQLRLAMLYLEMRDFGKCDMLLAGLLPKLEREYERIEAHYCMGELRLARGDVGGAEKAFQAALKLAGAYSNYSCGRIHFDQKSIQGKLEALATIPRVPGLQVNWHRMDRVLNGYSELACGRAFCLDPARWLCAWDPIRQEGAVLAVMPQALCDFIPLDRQRVFVAFTSGTVALYEEGKDRPIWRRSLSIGYNSYLSASPLAITVADDEGTLHALDPASGRTMWTRKVKAAPWPETYWKSARHLVQQWASGVVLPDKPDYGARAVECVDARTGETRWSCRPGFTIGEVAFCEELLFLAGSYSGDLAAISLEGGAVAWQKRLDVAGAHDSDWTALAVESKGRRLYLAKGDTIWAMDSATGDVMWSWRWKPRLVAGDPNKKRLLRSWLCAAENAVFFVVNWEAKGERIKERTDVAFLTKDGKVLLHETSPLYTPYYAGDVFVQGMKLAVRKDVYWEVWDVRDILNRALPQP